MAIFGGSGRRLGHSDRISQRRPTRPRTVGNRLGAAARTGYSVLELMIAMTVGSILLIGLTAGYSALSRAAARLAAAQAAMTSEVATPVCRAYDATPSTAPVRCALPEICAFDTVSRTCRTTA